MESPGLGGQEMTSTDVKSHQHDSRTGGDRPDSDRHEIRRSHVNLSLERHYEAVKTDEIGRKQVSSKTAASNWLTRGCDLLSCACVRC